MVLLLRRLHRNSNSSCNTIMRITNNSKNITSIAAACKNSSSSSSSSRDRIGITSTTTASTTTSRSSSRGKGATMVVIVAWVFCLALDLCTAAAFSTTSRNNRRSIGEAVTKEDPVWEIRHVLPDLDLENNTVTDVKVNVGDVAYLPCRFPQLSTMHQVSWIRRWDWHILTTGIYTYTSDLRFNVLHTQGSDDWTLQLKYVHTRDNGTYECQMYTGTGVLSQFVNLHVNTPRAAILGPHELHVQEGDSITLVCVIQQSKPPFVFWYEGENMVNYDGSRDRLSVITEVEDTRTLSRLTITHARHGDSGNYSCIPPNVMPAYVLVFVTQGDTVAAVHSLSSSTSLATSIVTLVVSTASSILISTAVSTSLIMILSFR